MSMRYRSGLSGKLLLLSILGFLTGQREIRGMTLEIATAGTEYIKAGDTWRFFRGKQAPSSPADAWKGTGFIDTSWESGPSGFGYGDDDDATVLSDMEDSYITVYIRKEFTVSSIPPDAALELVIDYDDGFIAYLNGGEVARRHMPDGAATYQTQATSHEAGTPEVIPLGSAASLLHAGTNLLAIEGHNTDSGSTDFSLIPALRTVSGAVKEGSTWIVGTPTVPILVKTTAAGVASVKIGGSSASYDPASGKWQGNASLSPGMNDIAVQALDASLNVVEQGTIAILYIPPSNHVSGTLPGSAVWSGDWVVDDAVTVPQGATLTIEAGSTIRFKSTASLTVRGQLLADGTSAAPIRFTHYGDGTTWERIMLIQAADSLLRYCTMEFNDSEGEHQDYYVPGSRTYHEALVVLASHIDIENCLFQKMPDESSAAEGDALAIMSDDPDYPGAASANIRDCRFQSIGQGVHERFSYVLVERCTFQGKRGDNDDVDLWGESDPPPMIRYNQFLLPEHDDRINPTRCSAVIIGNYIAGGDDHGMVLRDKCSPIVMNNVIAGCSSGGIAVENSCTALLVNNTIYNCSRGLRLFDLGRWDPPYSLNPGGGTATAINCIIWNCAQAATLADSSNTQIADPGSHLTVINCDIQGGQSTISVSGSHSTVNWGAGNIDANPLFVNAGTADFHLQEGSPAIDSGTADRAPATDKDGNPRPCEDGFDMGAYEVCEAIPELFRRGDANADGEFDLSDPIRILFYMFASISLPCVESADANDDAAVEISDVSYLLGYLFLGTAAPPPPLAQCGADSTGTTLGCASYPPCP